MGDTKITQADLDTILKLVESAEHLGDFHLRYGDLELRISRAPAGATIEPPVPSSPPSAPPALEPAPARATSDAPTATRGGAKARNDAVPPGSAVVKAPMVGTFYRAPSPGAKPFIEVGDRVAPDTVVCIIEVMKLMNTIHAGAGGVVREIRVANSEAVEFGQVLIVIEPES